MEYDEIDSFVDKLFSQGDGDGKPTSDKWHTDRIDEIIQETFDNAIWWHNNRISEGGDPRSGLRGLPYVPWDENIDGVAAMQGAIGGLSDSSYARNGAPAAHPQPEKELSAKRDGLSCGELALIVAVAVGLLLFMALWGSLGEIVRLP